MTSPQNNAKAAIWILTAAVGIVVFVMLRPFAEAMIAGALLAIVFHAPHVRIRKRIHSATWSAVISTTLMILVFIVPVGLLIPSLTSEVRDAVAALHSPDALIEQVAGWVRIPLEDFKKLITARLQEAGEAMLRQSLDVIGIATGGIINTVVAVGSFFFVIRDGEALREESLAVSPLGPERTSSLLQVAGEMIQASVYGVLGVAVTQGILCGIGLWIAGFPAPLLWGLATAAVSVLPLFGSALVWVPAAIILFAKGSTGSAIFLLLWGGGIVALADNVVQPWILTTRVPINPLLVLVAMLGSIQAFGFIGVIAGPVVLAIFLALLRTLREEALPVGKQ